MSEDEINILSDNAKKRIKESYSWEHIADQYKQVFLKT